MQKYEPGSDFDNNIMPNNKDPVTNTTGSTSDLADEQHNSPTKTTQV